MKKHLIKLLLKIYHCNFYIFVLRHLQNIWTNIIINSSNDKIFEQDKEKAIEWFEKLSKVDDKELAKEALEELKKLKEEDK